LQLKSVRQSVLHWQFDRHHWKPSFPYFQQHRWLKPLSQLHALPGLSVHPPHWQLDPHTFCEHESQPPVVVPGLHTPWPWHVPHDGHAQLDVQVRYWVPHRPQPWDCWLPGAQAPWPVQDPQPPHEQLELHERVRMPQFPQEPVSVSPGEQTPWPEHVPHEPQEHEELQYRVCEPQSPQGRVSESPGVHTPPPPHEPQLLHTHPPRHVRVW